MTWSILKNKKWKLYNSGLEYFRTRWLFTEIRSVVRQQKIARIRLFSGNRAILTTRLRSLSVAQRSFIETGAFCCRATDERKPGVKVLRTVLREIVDSKYVPSNGSEEFCSVFFFVSSPGTGDERWLFFCNTRNKGEHVSWS